MKCSTRRELHGLQEVIVLSCDRHCENGNHFDEFYRLQWQDPFEDSTVPAKVPVANPPKKMWVGKHDPKVEVLLNA